MDGFILECKTKGLRKFSFLLLLYTLPININGYVPFLINILDTIVMRLKYIKQSPLAVVTFFMLLAGIVFCSCYKNFHFISHLRFGYFSFCKLFVRSQQS